MTVLQAREAATDVLRDDSWHLDPTSDLYLRGTLVEGQATNEDLHSREFDNAWWTKVRLEPLVVDTVAAPDQSGTVEAEKVIPNSTNNSHVIWRTGETVSAGAYYFRSCFHKAAGYSWSYIDLIDGGSSDRVRQYYDLSNGVLGSTQNNGAEAEIVYAAIEPYEDGWYRVILIGRPNSTYTTLNTTPVGVASADASHSFAGDGTSGIYAWQADRVAGRAIQSPIETTTATVTRPADSGVELFENPPVDGDHTWYFRTIYYGDPDSHSKILMTTGSHPWFRIETWLGDQINCYLRNDNNAARATVEADFSIGDRIEVLANIYKATGECQGHVSLNGQGVVSSNIASTGAELDAYGSTHTIIQPGEPHAVLGDDARKQYGVYVEPGIKTMDQMRTLAGWS